MNNGISMKDCILRSCEEIEKVLGRSALSEEDKTTITDALHEMAYQWCTSNASSCAMEAFLKENEPETYERIMHSFLKSDTYHKTYQDTMRKTFPEQFSE